MAGLEIERFSFEAEQPPLDDLHQRLRRTICGGHFAAWEQPELLAQDIRNLFRPLRATG